MLQNDTEAHHSRLTADTAAKKTRYRNTIYQYQLNRLTKKCWVGLCNPYESCKLRAGPVV